MFPFKTHRRNLWGKQTSSKWFFWPKAIIVWHLQLENKATDVCLVCSSAARVEEASGKQIMTGNVWTYPMRDKHTPTGLPGEHFCAKSLHCRELPTSRGKLRKWRQWLRKQSLDDFTFHLHSGVHCTVSVINHNELLGGRRQITLAYPRWLIHTLNVSICSCTRYGGRGEMSQDLEIGFHNFSLHFILKY